MRRLFHLHPHFLSLRLLLAAVSSFVLTLRLGRHSPACVQPLPKLKLLPDPQLGMLPSAERVMLPEPPQPVEGRARGLAGPPPPLPKKERDMIASYLGEGQVKPKSAASCRAPSSVVSGRQGRAVPYLRITTVVPLPPLAGGVSEKVAAGGVGGSGERRGEGGGSSRSIVREGMVLILLYSSILGASSPTP